MWADVFSNQSDLENSRAWPSLRLSNKSEYNRRSKRRNDLGKWIIVTKIFSFYFSLLDMKAFLFMLPGGSGSKESACNAEDLGSIPGSGRLPREGNGNPLQYSCLEKFMHRAWWTTLHGVTKSWT